MFDTAHAHEPIFTKNSVQLDRDDAWVHDIYCRHLKPKGSEEIPPVDLARQLIKDVIRSRCTNLEILYKSNDRPAKPFQERVHMVIEALETPTFNGTSI